MPGAGPLVECRDASRTYGSGRAAVVAVHGATCRIDPGSRIAVLGASGSGKSTLLHLMAGLEIPTTGSVGWLGDLRGPGDQRRPGDLAVVFQGPSLVPALDVTENVALPLLLAGQDDDSARAWARDCLARIGVDDLADRLPEELSGGQAQRVAVARVLAARPRLILADEPTGQLDRATAERVVDVLLEAAAELDAALVVSTHDRRVAERLDRCWRMHDGRLDTDSVES